MVARSKYASNSVRQKPPLPKQAKLAAFARAAVVGAAAAAVGVHVATSGPAPVPVAAASYAGSLELNASGSQLASWNQTSKYCTEDSWEVPDGAVSTGSSGDATLSTTGKPGSCAAIISPQAYS